MQKSVHEKTHKLKAHLVSVFRKANAAKVMQALCASAILSVTNVSYSLCPQNVSLNTPITIASNMNSENWAGYYVSTSQNSERQIIRVRGKFTVPQITKGCDYAKNGLDTKLSNIQTVSIWLGIGGIKQERSLIQIGVQLAHYPAIVNSEISINNKKNPTANLIYTAFYETIPDVSNVESTTKIPDMAIYPGDIIKASITRGDKNSDVFKLSLTDQTQNQHFSKNITFPVHKRYGIPHETAEWIVEKLFDGKTNSYLPLAGFDNIKFIDPGVVFNNSNGTRKTSGDISNFDYAHVNLIETRKTSDYGISKIKLMHITTLSKNESNFQVTDAKCEEIN